MIVLFLLWFLFYIFDGIAVVGLIQALGNDELDFMSQAVVGVATVILSVFLDLMLANEFGAPGLYGACGITAIVVGAALKFVWEVEIKRVALICLFFCAFHVGLLRNVASWLS